MTKSRFNTRLWGIPLLIAILSLGGLITALVGDDCWDILSWLALGIPLALTVKYLWK